MKKRLISFTPLLIILGLIIFRFLLTGLAFHNDILSNAGWGQWIYLNGLGDFYRNTHWIYSWPSQPPLMSWFMGFEVWFYYWSITATTALNTFIALNHLGAGHLGWWFEFLNWYSKHYYQATPFTDGLIISQKIGPILADLIIALMIWRISVNHQVIKIGKYLPYIYLISPYSWYISALWGQNDPISYIFLFLALIAVYSKQYILAPIIFTVSVCLKPTGLVFVPLLIGCLWIYAGNEKKKPMILFSVGSVISLVFLCWQLSWFNSQDYLGFAEELIDKIFFKSEFRVSTNSFNFWRILIGNQALRQETQFLLIPANIWGYLAIIWIYKYAFKTLARKRFQDLLVAISVVGLGSWLFMTNMLDRYAFAGITTLLLVCLYKPQIFRYWVILSLIFWLNLYHTWWFPEWLNFLKVILSWGDGIVTRLLSLINVIIYLKVLSILKSKK